MKVLSSILTAIVALPICISIVGSYIVGTKALISQEIHASMYWFSHNLSSEPAMMILIGASLIAVAGFGRKRLLKKDNKQKNKQNLSSAIPPYPDPVPWKKDA